MDKKSCSFSTILDDRGSVTYECTDDQYSEGYCRFHSSEFAAIEENKAVLVEILGKKVNDANNSGSPLKLIGYTFPKGFPMRYTFRSPVEFDRAQFLGEADFTALVFEKDVSFYETQFKGGANFSQATFNGEASFLSTTFDGETKANFSQATFNGEASFRETIFNVEGNFHKATFNGEAEFYEPSFNGENEADFSNATFNGEASFNGTTFGGKADFRDTTFEEDTTFSYSTFNRDAYFRDTTFEEDTTFVDSTFNGDSTFDGSRFNRVLSFSNNTLEGTISFAEVFFKEKDLIRFNGDLSKVSFVNTDITRVRFGDVIWGKNQAKSGKIHDERVIEEDVKHDVYATNSLESVIAEYRNLRENYEYYLRYEEAGKFFTREMELRRNYTQPLSTSSEKIKKRNRFARNLGLIGLYRLVCDYGESIRKPVIIIICTFIFATIFFSYENEWSTENFDPVRKTLAAFFPFFSLNNDPSLPEMILKATMLPMVGLIFITLRRKLERRFRH